MDWIVTESHLAGLASALVGTAEKLSPEEFSIATSGVRPGARLVSAVRGEIMAGGDPLGSAFTRIRSAKERRARGATYTPAAIINSMLSWAADNGSPKRIVDPGAGSGRFLLAAAQQFRDARLVGIEVDPLAALVLRVNVTVLDLGNRVTVLVQDYRDVTLPAIRGQTLFIGNPPYVRHHEIPADRKAWFSAIARRYGIKASKLAGLHLHFFFKTMDLARTGDYGTMITAAEWLDVNYGSALRELLNDGMGGCSLHVLDPRAKAFADATTTSAITCFKVNKRPSRFTVRAVDDIGQLGRLAKGRSVPWEKMASAPRWSAIIRPTPPPPSGHIEIGELFSVHRGQVTGNNKTWIAGREADRLPEDILYPCVTKARELIQSGTAMESSGSLRNVVDIPADLDEIDSSYRNAVDSFLDWARSMGADGSYVARHRKAWWSVGLRTPAPVLCTYMARRPPAFVRNLCGARHINIAHGLYPREPIQEPVLEALLSYLRKYVDISQGRTYAGGLVKFEPREIERIHIPHPENLVQ